MKFSIKDFFSKCDQFPADLVTFTEEILNENLNFLISAQSSQDSIAYWPLTVFLFRSLMEFLIRKPEIHWGKYCNISML